MTKNNVEYDKVSEAIREDGKSRWGVQGYNRIVFANGCFDILHVGHVSLLNECRKIAGPKGAVVVGVNSDASVQRLKGQKRPLIGEVHRCTMLVNLRSVDYVVTFDEDTPLELIKSIRPDIIVKGDDYKGKDVVGSDISSVVLVPTTKDVSSTLLIEKIKKNG